MIWRIKIDIIGLFWTEVAAVELDYLLHHFSILSILSSKAASFDHNKFDCLLPSPPYTHVFFFGLGY
jgi:hypothetical protein